MKRIAILVVLVPAFLALSFSISISAGVQSTYKKAGSLELIENAYVTGKITKAEKIFYDVQNIFAPQDLPQELRSDAREIIRSATPLVDLALDNWSILTPGQQSVLSSYFSRPATAFTYISPETHFAIHYDTTNSNSVPNTDTDQDGIPDFVERIGIYVDSSFRYYHNNLGYLSPPSDGDSFYDVYLLRLGDAYGVTIRENPGDSAWQDYSSYMMLHNTFDFAPPNQDPEGAVIGAQKVTCAHEFYHATQLAYAYKGWPDLWWTEGTATYFEDAVFDEVNDLYSYLPFFFNRPDTSLIDTSYYMSFHNYGAFIWPSFLAEKFGKGIIRNVWENIRYFDPLPSIDSSLRPLNENVMSTFPEFTVWNYFTGYRADTIYHDEGASFPLIGIDQIVPLCPFTDITAVNPPDGLASNYIVTYPDETQDGLLVVNFDGNNLVGWGFSCIAYEGGIPEVTLKVPVNSYGNTDWGIYDFSRIDSIVFIPCVVTPAGDDNTYHFNTHVHPFGDVNGSGDINVLDVSYLVNFLYRGGLSPKYSMLMGDTDCSGVINLIDVSRLIGFLYKGGPEPCAYHR